MVDGSHLCLAAWAVPLAALACGCAATTAARRPFVTVEEGRLVAGDEPYRFVGANLWYGMPLASEGPGGDRERLLRELDRLAGLGVTNLRVMAGTEGPDETPYRVSPSLQPAPGEHDEAQLDGLDFLLAAMGQRGMRAVLCLTNFWFWSGGMAQYVAWHGGGPIPYPEDTGGDWDRFARYAAQFYDDDGAQADYAAHVERLLLRDNPYTGLAYRQDPTIMAWELANEPRGMDRPEAMRGWIHRAAEAIDALDERHLITTGSEGDSDRPGHHGLDFVRDHESPHIDYATAHVWIQNWRWYEPGRAEATYDGAESRALTYVRSHVERAAEMGMPLVLEEFGIARDGGSFVAASATTMRDRYLTAILAAVAASARADEPLAGSNFWAWGGEGRPGPEPGGFWRPGEPLIGDPAHEPQGWYSIYDHDESTLEVLRRAVAELRRGSSR